MNNDAWNAIPELSKRAKTLFGANPLCDDGLRGNRSGVGKNLPATGTDIGTSLQHAAAIDPYEKTHAAAATMYDRVHVKYYSNDR